MLKRPSNLPFSQQQCRTSPLQYLSLMSIPFKRSIPLHFNRVRPPVHRITTGFILNNRINRQQNPIHFNLLSNPSLHLRAPFRRRKGKLHPEHRHRRNPAHLLIRGAHRLRRRRTTATIGHSLVPIRISNRPSKHRKTGHQRPVSSSIASCSITLPNGRMRWPLPPETSLRFVIDGCLG